MLGGRRWGWSIVYRVLWVWMSRKLPIRLDSSLWVYGLLKWRNECESGGVVVLLVAVKSHCDLQQMLFQMPWIYISRFVFSVEQFCNLRIILFWQTQQVSPFLILSVFRAVKCFCSAYSNIMLAYTGDIKKHRRHRDKSLKTIMTFCDTSLLAFKL
jgi:hypothetical protein